MGYDAEAQTKADTRSHKPYWIWWARNNNNNDVKEEEDKVTRPKRETCFSLAGRILPPLPVPEI